MNNNSVKNYGKRTLAKGVTVSNNTFETGLNNNDIIFGTSGCGKTGGYVVPMLQNPAESMIVVDTKNNLSKMFKASLEAKGYRVQVIDFVSPKNSTCGYNPLAYVRTAGKGKFNEMELKSVAHALVSEQLSRDDRYWVTSARKYLTMLFAYVMCGLPEKDHNLTSVIDLHSAVCVDAKGIKEEMVAAVEEMAARGAGGTRMLCNLIGQVFGTLPADRTWSCIMDFASAALAPYDTDDMQYIFSRKKTLDIAGLGREKTVVFLNISDMNRAFDDIINLFYLQLFQKLEEEASRNRDGRLKMPVRILMDDFASGTKMDDFDKIISVIRSRDISVSLVIQSLSQLESLYGAQQSRTILNNCDHLIYMGGNDEETLRYVSMRADKPISRIAQKPKDKIYLMESGEAARLVDKISPYSTMRKASVKAPAQAVRTPLCDVMREAAKRGIEPKN